MTLAASGSPPQSPRRLETEQVGNSAGKGKAGTSRAAAVAKPRSIGSKEWSAVAADPLVERVRAAVDGTLFDIRPMPEDAVSGSADETEDGDTSG